MYSDADAAALYGHLNPWVPSDDFHLSYVMASPSVPDVGCGTGMLLHRARRRADIEWVLGTAAGMAWDRESSWRSWRATCSRCS